MTEQKFRSEMRRAEALRSTSEPMMAEYWHGYARGLRRAYHGEKFGNPGEHEQWAALADSDNEPRAQRGRGYRDGLAYGEMSSVIGRPKTDSTVLDRLSVPMETREGLARRAGELGVTLPEIRRMAYREYLGMGSMTT